MQDIKDFTLAELEQILLKWKQKSFHARQIFSWIYKKGAADFDSMSDLPAGLRAELKDKFYVYSFGVVSRRQSCDGTEKLLFKLQDENTIETVLIPAERRATVCISSQVGCKFACGFCASGLSGFKRNLTCAEILEEVLYLKQSLNNKLTHIVFMGTGEPLDNYGQVIKAIRIINSPQGLNIGARRITISTVGVIPGIMKLAGEGLQVELSVSLHASDEKTRSELMPINKKYPLKDLIRACREYINKTDRQVTFEYILIKGINARPGDALGLSKLLKELNCKVNLILANPVKECSVEPPNKLDILLFKDTLLKQGINVTLRKSRGQDIQAACGQLRLRYETK